MAMGLVTGLFSFFALGQGRMERLRKPFFIALTLVTSLALVFYIQFSGITSFKQWVAAWPPGYYFPGFAVKGTIPYPGPMVLPSVFWGGTAFSASSGLWQTTVPNTLGSFFLFMVPYIIIFAVFGRAFCGWLCPLGGLPELMSSGGKEWWLAKPLTETTTVTGALGYTGLKGWVKAIRYVLLALLVLLSLLLGFSLVNIFFPVLWLKSMTAFWTTCGILLVLAVVLPFVTKRRWWCYICPVGAAMALFDRISLFRVKIDKEKCVKCMDCVHACRMYAMTPQGVEAGRAEAGYCVRCGRCVDACSEEAIDICWMGGQKKARRPFVALAIATSLALYVWYVDILVFLSSRIGNFHWFS
jgi:NapH/MauN family ferredoxin-type protein